jgi:uncharacterized OsmC-like protein
MQTTVENTMNGVNVQQLLETINAVKDQPALGAAKFRARNRWISGGHNRSKIQGFYAAGQEDATRSQPFVLDTDEPAILVGGDQAPNPVEYVLHALTACLTTSMVYHAAARGIQIEELESTLEGDLDLRGFMGIAPDVRKGYQNIRVNFTVKSDASAEQLRELAQFSPVFDTIRNPVAVTVQIATK